MESVYDDKPHVVVPLIALAVMANVFLFAVTFTNASFTGAERALPDPFAPAQISKQLDSTFNAIAENITWSVSTALAEVKPQVVAFIGLQNYKFGMPRYTALNNAVDSAADGQVLGANIVNPEYSGGLLPIPTPHLIVIQLK